MLVSYWLISITEPCWGILLKARKYGFKRRLNDINPEDVLVFYVVSSGKIKGIFRVKSDWREEQNLLWADEKESRKLLYPYRVRIEAISTGEVGFKELAKKLNFVKNKKAAPVYLRGALANFGRPIPEEDFELILGEMTKEN